MVNQEKSTQVATVVELDGDQAILSVLQGGCGRCHEEGGCGGQQLTQMFCSSAKTFRVENTISAQVGDQVHVAIAAGALRDTANLVYGIPLMATLVGAVLGSQWHGDGGAMVGAGLALVMAVLYVRFRAVRHSGKLSVKPHLISRS